MDKKEIGNTTIIVMEYIAFNAMNWEKNNSASLKCMSEEFAFVTK